MRILTFLFIFSLVAMSSQSYAQEMTRDEKKELKSQLRYYKRNLETFQQLLDEHRLYQKQAEEFERQLNALRASQGQEDDQLARKQQEVADLNQQLMEARTTIQRLQTELASRPETPVTQPPAMQDNYLQGLVFRVQIGAYRKTAAPGQATSTDQMTIESSDGMQKIMIGNFRNYVEAKELADYFKQIGLKDAWVVAYRDGARIPLTEALGTDN